MVVHAGHNEYGDCQRGHLDKRAGEVGRLVRLGDAPAGGTPHGAHCGGSAAAGPHSRRAGYAKTPRNRVIQQYAETQLQPLTIGILYTMW